MSDHHKLCTAYNRVSEIVRAEIAKRGKGVKKFLFALVLIGCGPSSAPPQRTVSPGENLMPAAILRTIDHDSHRWVVLTVTSSDGGVALVHHPDCPSCVTAEAKP
jgi:hypothetical protein